MLSHVADLETAERAQRSVERRMKRSRLGRFKPMADFEWDWPTRIDREAVEAAVHLDFLAENRNVVLIAAQGLGKTMVAQNIAHQAVQKGHTALFTTASQMLLDLCGQDSARALERRLKHYERPTVLCIDEVGLPTLRRAQRRPALPGGVSPARGEADRPHHQSGLRRLGPGLPQRQLRHCPD